MSAVSVADSLFRPHPEQRARASREPKKKETIVDTDANFAQKYMSAGCHSWRSASFVCTLGTAWRMKVFVKKSIVNLMLRFVVCLLSLMFDVLLARADQ